MFRNGTLPIPVEQFSTGTIVVYPLQAQTQSKDKIVLYGRVSSHDQQQDLFRQMTRLKNFSAKQGLVIHKEVEEIASGLNDRRPKLLRLLQDSSVTTIVVEHRDRLTRFCFPLLEAALTASGRKILVVNQSEIKEDLVQDFIDIVTSMCSKLYGRRSAKNRAKRALDAASSV